MKKLCVSLLAALIGASLCGCVWFMEKPEEEKQQTVYEPVQDVIEATPEPTRKENPVSAFYGDYYDACGAMEELFQSRLEGEPSKEAADTLIYLAEHDLAVSQGKITFGWLLSTDTEGSFSSISHTAVDISGAFGHDRDPSENSSDGASRGGGHASYFSGTGMSHGGRSSGCS